MNEWMRSAASWAPRVGWAYPVALLAWSLAWAGVANAQIELTPPAEPVLITSTPHNLHLVVTEEFLNRFVARNEAEPGRVDDFIFGAKVDGERYTARQVRLDLQPSWQTAQASFVLTGQVNSLTVGRTEQGAVQTMGYQEFIAYKPVFFDGNVLSTKHATVFVRAMTQPLAASTRLDGTILAGLGRKIALNRAEQQRPKSEAYARDRVADQVYPAFDNGIDQKLGLANQQLTAQLRTSLERISLLPTSQRAISTDTHLHYAVRIGLEADAGDVPTPRTKISGPHAVSLYVHDGLLNGLIDRLQLNGKKTSDRELRSIFDRAAGFIGTASADSEVEADYQPELPGMPSGLETEIEFDAVNPLSIHFRDGQAVIEIRATLKPAGQSLLPPLLIATPLQLVNQGAEWKLVRGPIQIESTSGQRLPDIAEQLIRQSIEKDVPSVTIPRELDIPEWPAEQRKLQLSDLKSVDGWLAVSLD